MKKIIKKYGGSFIVSFSTEEMKIYGLEEGDVIEMEINKLDSKIKKDEKKPNEFNEFGIDDDVW